MLIVGTDGDMRRKHEWEILAIYYDKLVELLKRGNMAVPFTFEQVSKVIVLHFHIIS